MLLRLSHRSPAATTSCDPAAGRDCEHPATPGRTTLGLAGFGIALAIALAACGGGHHKHKDAYAGAVDAQGACCEHLSGPQRDQCLAGIVKAPDEAVAKSDANQATYACVQEHFECNPATGKATQQSAQDQLDCIQDLPK